MATEKVKITKTWILDMDSLLADYMGTQEFMDEVKMGMRVNDGISLEIALIDRKTT